MNKLRIIITSIGIVTFIAILSLTVTCSIMCSNAVIDSIVEADAIQR